MHLLEFSLQVLIVDMSGTKPPLFCQYNATISQDRTNDTWVDKAPTLAQTTSSHTLLGIDHSLPLKRDSYFDRDLELDTKLHNSALSLYGSDPALGGLHSMGLSRAAAAGRIVTQVSFRVYVNEKGMIFFFAYLLVV